MVERSRIVTWLDGQGEIGREYRDEAEHSHGEGYWNRFSSLSEIQQDFAKYAMKASPCNRCGCTNGYVDKKQEIRCSACDKIQK